MESPRIPVDTVVIPMRKVLEPTEANQNGKPVYLELFHFLTEWLDVALKGKQGRTFYGPCIGECMIVFGWLAFGNDDVHLVFKQNLVRWLWEGVTFNVRGLLGVSF